MDRLRNVRISFVLVGFVSWGAWAQAAELRLACLFSDHAVLQCDAPVPVWGWADPGAEVCVDFAGQRVVATADKNGKWMARLGALKACAEPGALVVTDAKTRVRVQVQDVLVGEVWLGSGQSNMAMTVNRAKDFEAEKGAASLPQVRMFKEESAIAKTEQAEGKGSWVVCTPETVGSYSATLYFFGREIHKSLNTPVGLINSSVGGTPIESWVAEGPQRACEALKPFFASVAPAQPEADTAEKERYAKALARWEVEAKKARAAQQPLPRKPRDPAGVRERKANVGGLFNGKIAPLIPYAIRGAVWYQGEANSTPVKAPFYQHQLPLLIKDWRARWGYEFPFAWAQLPNFAGEGRDWPTIREAMLKTLALPKTGMGVNIDIGEEKNIHPANKQEVGRRLSLWALGAVYGRTVASTAGPLPAGSEVRGSEIVLTFSHADNGLVAKGGELKGFAVAGEDRQWKPAHARIEGAAVVVSSPEVAKPAAARYAWENFPACNLYNGAGLPASPFRTDDWK
jgi:sialate O-acetylesterase